MRGAAIRTLFFAGLVLAFCAPVLATEWPKTDIPPDPSVTFGVLPNGMRYAIRQNATPTGEVSVRLRIGAGAMQESAEQRGLAHYLEHLAFRGSARLADGEINKTLSRMGLRFGADTNASTGQDQTIYQFDLPKSDDKSVDTVLGFAREIASNLTLDPEAAKTEAGVVLSELSMRDMPSFRALQSQFEFMLQDPHASAFANGDPAVIAKAPVGLIRDYYRAYYRPERATLVVVGDINPARMEAKIRRVFSDWKGVGPAGSDPAITIASSRGLETRLFTEASAPSRIQIAWVRPPKPRPGDLAAEKSQLVDYVGMRILGRRLQEASASAARPFTRAAVSQDQVLDAAELVMFSIGFEEGRWRPALTAADRIRLDLLQSGVEQSEVDRAALELHTSFERSSLGASTRPSPAIVSSILNAISENEVFTSTARDLAAADADLKGLTADEVSQALRDLFKGNGPLIFVSSPEPIEGGADAVRAAFLESERTTPSAMAMQRTAPADWPYTNFGTPGTVVQNEKIADLGTQFVHFANGVRLTVRPSKLRANQVLVSVKVGGGRLDLPTDKPTVAWAAGALTTGGLQAMNFTDMQRSLALKSFRVGFGVREDGFVFTGGTTPADIDTQLQVFAAYIQSPGFRPEAFEQVKTGYATRLKQIGVNAAAVMQMKAPEILHDGDKRWVSPSAQDVNAATVEDLKALLLPVFAKGAIDITITGDITPEAAIQAVAATFGAFAKRAEPRPVVGAANDTHFPQTTDVSITIPGSTQAGQQIISATWPTHGQFPDIQDSVTLDLMGDIMEERLFDRLRGLGTVYVAQVGNAASRVFDYGYVQAMAQLPPEKVQQFHDALSMIVTDLQTGKLSSDDLERARNPALQQLRKSQQTNEYWLSVLDGAQENPAKLDLVRKYDVALQRVTRADIAAAARKYLESSRVIKLSTGS